MVVPEEDADWMAEALPFVRLFFSALTVFFVGSMVNPRKGASPAGREAVTRCFFIVFGGDRWAMPTLLDFNWFCDVVVFAWTKEGKNME